MDEERSLSDVLWDYGVFVPIGLAASLVEELGRLTEKGKQHAGGQVHTAQMIGKLAVGQGKRQFTKLFGEATSGGNHRAARSEASDGGPARSPSGATSRRQSAAQDGSSSAAASRRPASAATRSAATRSGAPRSPDPTEGSRVEAVAPAGRDAPEAPEAASLAIPGYDTLAASQVVQRLSSLRPDELEAIRRYELATRGRRTILHRIAQLTTEG